MRIDILSLFPGYFQGPFDESIIKRAKQEGILDIHLVNIRDFAEGKHKKVDDRPYGGGPGMVLMPGPVAKAIQKARQPNSHVIYLSPQGTQLTAAKCKQLASKEHLILLCGHYEGIDERVLEQEIDEEISIGDFVLTNGCLPAIVIVDAISRFLPGVLGNDEAADQDSFQRGIFDCPHYTRPLEYQGLVVPGVLCGGDHEAVELWRYAKALEKTKEIRPELYAVHLSELRKHQKSVKQDKGTAEESGSSVNFHPILIVSDLKKSIAFYKKTMAFQLVEKGEQSAKMLLEMHNKPLEIHLVQGLQESPAIRPTTLFEIIIQDQEVFEGFLKRFTNVGCLQVNECVKAQILTCVDPDGYQWCIALNPSCPH